MKGKCKNADFHASPIDLIYEKTERLNLIFQFLFLTFSNNFYFYIPHLFMNVFQNECKIRCFKSLTVKGSEPEVARKVSLKFSAF